MKETWVTVLEGKPIALTYKNLVKLMTETNTREEYNALYSIIEYSAQHEKITHQDEAVLLLLLSKIRIEG